MDRKKKQLAALELMLTMLVSMNKMEGQETRYSYQNSNEHRRHQNVMGELCTRLGLEPATVEDELRRLACQFMGEPTLLIPNQTINIGQNNDLWRKVSPSKRPSLKLPPALRGSGSA